MSIDCTRLTSEQLSRAAALQGKIELLEQQLLRILGAGTAAPSGPAAPRIGRAGKGKMSAAARARISAGQKARWALRKQAKKITKTS